LAIKTLFYNLSIAIVTLCTVLYAVLSLLPILYQSCPYQTPFSSLYWVERRLSLKGHKHAMLAAEDAFRHALEVLSKTIELDAFGAASLAMFVNVVPAQRLCGGFQTTKT